MLRCYVCNSESKSVKKQRCHGYSSLSIVCLCYSSSWCIDAPIPAHNCLSPYCLFLGKKERGPWLIIELGKSPDTLPLSHLPSSTAAPVINFYSLLLHFDICLASLFAGYREVAGQTMATESWAEIKTAIPFAFQEIVAAER